jgi:hypothetical protein
MRKFVAVLTTVFFLMVPTALLAQGTEGNLPGGKDGSVKVKKVEKKSAQSKKKAPKKATHSKHKTKKAGKSVKDVSATPKI